jgi:hypothetical protein
MRNAKSPDGPGRGDIGRCSADVSRDLALRDALRALLRVKARVYFRLILRRPRSGRLEK